MLKDKSVNTRKSEVDFQKEFVKLINLKLNKNFVAYQGRSIYYQLQIDSTFSQNSISQPKRGRSAFETDIAIFRKFKNNGVISEQLILVIEVKNELTTHDVIVYNNKAQRHKGVYPYLRYGLLCYGISSIPKRFFIHNNDLDFCITIKDYINSEKTLQKILYNLVKKELNVYNNFRNKNEDDDKYNFYQVIPNIKNI